MVQGTQEITAEEEQLDARLAELLHVMHREHVALEQAPPS
jgi:hypothetical protein